MTENLSEEEKIKIILLGESTVGKTSIINRFMERDFETHELGTIGIEQIRKKIKIKISEKTIFCILKIYDSAGQERFKSLSNSYIRQSDGIVIVYDISNKKSFDSIVYWMKNIKDNKSNDYIPIIIVGNKIDLEEKRKVFQNDIDRLFKNNADIFFLESSAKNNYNINQIFETISEKVIQNRKLNVKKRTDSFRLSFNNKEKEKEKKRCCSD